MKAWGVVVIASLSGGCARGSAELLDATIVPVNGTDASDLGQPGSDADVSPTPPDPQPDARAGCLPGEPDCVISDKDASVTGHDGGRPGQDAGPPGHDAGPGERDSGSSTSAFFLVRQVNAALQEPVATNIQLKVGDQVRLSGTGNIWPGLFGQGCNGPNGTSGAHEGGDWPLQGGPDFALVAHVNGAWALVGSDRTFEVTTEGVLLLGTNDDDNGSGDDCTSVPLAQQGFGVTVVVTSLGP